jgi:hypothetical protein
MRRPSLLAPALARSSRPAFSTLVCRHAALPHHVFSVINKGASDSMTITWTVTIS